jgi:flavodoxin I
MKNALVAFGSTTGNTAEVANWIAETLGRKGLTVESADCAGLSTGGLCAPYDLIVFGCSTYGDDEIEIQEDFEPILDDLENTDISGKKVAIFGCGDSAYPHFCGSVDAIEKRVGACGGELIVTSLKVDDPHPDSQDEIIAWATGLAKAA